MEIGSQGQSCHSIALRRCTTRLTFTPALVVYLLRRLVRWLRVHHIQPSVAVFQCLTWQYGCALGRKPTTGCGYPPSSCRAVLGCSTNVLKHIVSNMTSRESLAAIKTNAITHQKPSHLPGYSMPGVMMGRNPRVHGWGLWPVSPCPCAGQE